VEDGGCGTALLWIVVRRVTLLALPLLAALVVAIAAAAPAPPDARATAIVSRVVQPGVPDQISISLAAPAEADESLSGYAYPDDGSIVRIGSASAGVTAQPGVSSSAQGGVDGLAVSLFGGEITVETLTVQATAAAGTANASAGVSASSLTGLTVLGQPVAPAANTVVPLADWGTLEVLGSVVETTQEPPRSAQGTVTALRVKLSAEHAGLPVGSIVEIGTASAAATAAAPEVAPVVKPVRPKPAIPRRRPVVPASAPREPGTSIPGAPPELVRPAPEVTAQLTSGGYVFPVYGPASFGDTFGAPRSDVAGGWHHGEDISAPLGTPLLAVADGTIFSVGWNDIGGWRLWLRDRSGNEFYYAHLSAYSPLAVNGRHVNGGDVLGFMGRTGDAEFGPVHLHFEIHPVSLLARGYDGVVAPYPFLVAWRRAQDVSFDAGRAYLPPDGPLGRRGVAPPAGAVLLEADDISGTSGLVPGALEQALSGRAARARSGVQDR
jgi:murein DD-endopeptidase MepM/ murein hydrolase activator NlpD